METVHAHTPLKTGVKCDAGWRESPGVTEMDLRPDDRRWKVWMCGALRADAWTPDGLFHTRSDTERVIRVLLSESDTPVTL